MNSSTAEGRHEKSAAVAAVTTCLALLEDRNPIDIESRELLIDRTFRSS